MTQRFEFDFSPHVQRWNQLFAVNPRSACLSATIAGRCASVLGRLEELVGVGKSCIGFSELEARLASAETARVVEGALRGAPSVLGLFDELGHRVNDVVEWFAGSVGRRELLLRRLDRILELLSSRLGVFEGLTRA